MKRKILVMLFLALLAFSFCSKKNEAPADNGQNNIKTPVRAKKAVVASKKVIIIKTVNFLPAAPTVLNDIIAVPVVVDPGLENINFQYRWFVKDKEIPAATTAILGKTNFKKGNLLYCLVKAVAPDAESAWFRSALIRIGNSLPVLNLAPVQPFSAPGIFRYKINASDSDNDELMFQVTAPENEGILLEVESGLLSWKITKDTVKRLGESIPINFDIIDSDGGKTSGSITLNIVKTK